MILQILPGVFLVSYYVHGFIPSMETVSRTVSFREVTALMCIPRGVGISGSILIYVYVRTLLQHS